MSRNWIPKSKTWEQQSYVESQERLGSDLLLTRDLPENQDNKIHIQCPAAGCPRKFSSTGHVNRHIKSSVRNGPQKDPLWKEHEKARKDRKLEPLKEGPGSDNDNDTDSDSALTGQLIPDAPTETTVTITSQANPVTMAPEVRSAPGPRADVRYDGSSSTIPCLDQMPVHYHVPNWLEGGQTNDLGGEGVTSEVLNSWSQEQDNLHAWNSSNMDCDDTTLDFINSLSQEEIDRILQEALSPLGREVHMS